MGSIVPSAEVIDDLRSGFPAEQLQYLEVFTRTTVSAEQFSDYADTLRRTDDQILDSLDAAGITLSLITGFDRTACVRCHFRAQRFGGRARGPPSRPVFALRRCRHHGRRLSARRVRALGA